jgi:hypothetical protein
MRWVTRKNANVDRIACPWLIECFIDTEAEFLFVPAAEVASVAERERAIPYDVAGAELGHTSPSPRPRIREGFPDLDGDPVGPVGAHPHQLSAWREILR